MRGHHKGHDPGKQVKSASFKLRQEQLRVEHKVLVERKAHVEQGSSPLVGGIAASLIITQAMPGASASIFHMTLILAHPVHDRSVKGGNFGRAICEQFSATNNDGKKSFLLFVTRDVCASRI